MNHFDPPGLSLMMGVKALISQSSGTIEEISREVLVAVAAFLQDQGTKSDCGGLNNPDGFAAAAKKEYEELVAFRKHFDDLEKNRDTKKIPPVLSREEVETKIIDLVGDNKSMPISVLVFKMRRLGGEEDLVTESVRLLLTRNKLYLNDKMYLEVVKK